MPSTLQVTEVFDSIQGEGLETGYPTTFVRLAGCNLACAWCDTAYAQSGGAPMLVGEVAARCGSRVCITGGEPLLQEIDALLDVFEKPRRVSVETNGTTIPPPWARDRTTAPRSAIDGVLWSVAPKFGSSGETPDLGVLHAFADLRRVQFKFVFSSEADWQTARMLAGSLGLSCPVFLMPNGQDILGLTRWAWDRMGDWCGLDARLTPQMHVLVWGQDRCR